MRGKWILGLVGVLAVLLALDLFFHGAVWRFLQSFKSETTSTLPDEKRTVGKSHKTEVTFLS